MMNRNWKTKPASNPGNVTLAVLSFLLLNPWAPAQTLARPGRSNLAQQAVLPTQFDSAAIQQAIRNFGGAPLSSRPTMLFSGGADPATQRGTQTVLQGVWMGQGGSKSPPELAKVCAVPLLEHRADKEMDPGIWYHAPSPDPTGSGPRQITDPIAIPPPVPACPTQRR